LLDGVSLSNTRSIIGNDFSKHVREAKPFKEVIPMRFAERYKRRPEDIESRERSDREILRREDLIRTGEELVSKGFN
jgi:hypothetical protein